MGLALAYNNETFTLDENVKELVAETFVKLFKQKLIYQDYKLVNWDVKLQTAVSDIEVIHKPTKSKLYYFRYYLENNPSKYLVIATTRPETMFGDTHIFVNPKDERYKEFINKKAYNPVNNELLTILSDRYIDIKFGTGVMKCTPAHDFNDYNLAKTHKITNYHSIMNNDGTLNEFCKVDDVSYQVGNNDQYAFGDHHLFPPLQLKYQEYQQELNLPKLDRSKHILRNQYSQLSLMFLHLCPVKNP